VNVKTTMQLLVVEQLGLAMANRAVGQRFRDAVVFAETLVGAGAAGTWHPLRLRLPGYRRSKARIVALMQDVIADHRARGPDEQRAPDLIDALLAATDEQGRPLSEVDLIVGAQLPYIAGMDTAAATCAALLYALLKQPALLERVTAEVDAAFAHGMPSAQTFRHMPLLRAAMMETLRLYPVVPAAPRYVTRPFTFAGHRVEAGQTVLICTTGSHFLPHLFPRPYQFDVARYSDPRNEHRQPGAFGPFAAGPHTCPCAGLSEVLVMTTLATLLHAVRLRLDPPDYTLRKAIDPLPGPESRFSVRVVEQRARTSSREAIGQEGTGSSERSTDVAHGATATDAPDLRDPLMRALPSLERDVHDRIALKMIRLSYTAGTTIIAQGASADRFYIIVRGAAMVYHRPPGGREAMVRQLGSADYFGEIGLLQGVARTATVRATSDMEVLALDREDFLSMVAESDLVSAEIAALMQQRLAELQR
jgi:cytochrome P450